VIKKMGLPEVEKLEKEMNKEAFDNMKTKEA